METELPIDEKAPETEAGLEPRVYPVEIEIPVDRLDWLIGNLTHDDAIAALLQFDDDIKLAAMKFLIQRRVDELSLGPIHDTSDPVNESQPE